MNSSSLNRRMLLFLIVTTVATTLGMQVWLASINNFAVERAGLSALDMGIVQSVREIPGLLSLLVIFVLLRLSEHRALSFAAVFCGLGLALTGFFPSFWGIICTTLVMSLGFHFSEPLNQSLSLQHFDLQTAPIVIGRLRAAAALASIAGAVALWGLSEYFDYPALFASLGLLAAALAVVSLFMNPVEKPGPPQHKKMILRKRYWLYYVLTFLAGARRQILLVFAIYLLVKKFSYSVQDVTLLYLLNNVINYFLNPLIGKVINIFGERKLLAIESLCAISVFLVYAFTTSHILAGVAFVFDQLTFNFAIALRTYFQKIADPADIAPSSAVSFTINHIAAVFLPVMGGALWLLSDKIPFLTGAGLSLCSLILLYFMPANLQERANKAGK